MFQSVLQVIRTYLSTLDGDLRSNLLNGSSSRVGIASNGKML
jgi:hypothetical protein